MKKKIPRGIITQLLHSGSDTTLRNVPLSFLSSFSFVFVKNKNPHACNPSTLGGRGGWITRSRDQDHPGQHGETPSLLKVQKIRWAWWRVPVIPATQEAETGELPEPRRRRLWWAEIAPLHSSLGNKRNSVSKKKIKKKKEKRNKAPLTSFLLVCCQCIRGCGFWA